MRKENICKIKLICELLILLNVVHSIKKVENTDL